MHNGTIVPDEIGRYAYTDSHELPEKISAMLKKAKKGETQVIKEGKKAVAALVNIKIYLNLLKQVEELLREQPRRRKMDRLYPKKQ